MLPLQLHVKDYFYDRNYCEAVLASGEVVAFDPFVSCAIEMSDDDYRAEKGAELKNKSYLITSFSVQPWYDHDNRFNYMVTPNEGGIIEL